MQHNNTIVALFSGIMVLSSSDAPTENWISKILLHSVVAVPIRRTALMEYMSPDEIMALLTAAKNRSARAWAMLLLSYKHALRPSECCGLRMVDIDLNAGCIRIGRLKNGNDNRQELTGHKGKPLLD